jgi:hypothetical protein
MFGGMYGGIPGMIRNHIAPAARQPQGGGGFGGLFQRLVGRAAAQRFQPMGGQPGPAHVNPQLTPGQEEYGPGFRGRMRRPMMGTPPVKGPPTMPSGPAVMGGGRFNALNNDPNLDAMMARGFGRRRGMRP